MSPFTTKTNTLVVGLLVFLSSTQLSAQEPKNSKDLANKINYLKDNIKICNEMGRNARILAETTFDKSILCNKVVKTVEKIDP